HSLDLTPSIAINNLGRDDNVFNDSTNGKSDTSASFVPAATYWARIGRSRLRGQSAGEYLYFATYASQRGWSSLNQGRWEVPAGRLLPFVVGGYDNVWNRPNYEIDLRARTQDTRLGVGTEVHISGKSTIAALLQRRRDEYDSQQTFGGVLLARQLNH